MQGSVHFPVAVVGTALYGEAHSLSIVHEVPQDSAAFLVAYPQTIEGRIVIVAQPGILGGNQITHFHAHGFFGKIQIRQAICRFCDIH